MKKIFALLLAAAMLLSLCACGSAPAPQKPIEEMDDEDWEAAVEALEDMYEEEEPVVETEPTEKIYQVGETIVIGDSVAEVVIDSYCFQNTADWKYDIPADLNGSNEFHQTAEEGKTYLFVTATLNYIGEVKQDTNIYGQAEVVYQDGYKFGTEGVAFYGYKETSETQSFADAYARFEPLTDTFTREIRFYAEVPEVVETDTESPLCVEFMFKGTGLTYEYCTVQLR